MIADVLRKGLAWARSFFWVSDPGGGQNRSPSSAAPGPGVDDGTGAKAAGRPATTAKSSGDRRPAAAKTAANKRGASGAKRTGASNGAGKSRAVKGDGGTGGTGKSAGSATPGQGSGTKSSGPGAPEADRAKPGDLTEIKGIGPALKTKLGALGIESFADLAGANADRLAKNLGSRTITPERVRGWIAEAKKRC